MSDSTSISLSMAAENLKPWMPQIAELYVTLDLRLGWDAYLSALLSCPRSADDFTALLESIALNPEAFHTLTQNGGYPPAGEWVTVGQISGQVEKSEPWVRSRLSEHFLGMGEVRLIPHNNQPLLHYPPSVIPKLKKLAEEYPPAGNWLNVPQIADEVTQGLVWVKARLAEHFAGVRELRLGQNNKPIPHFPPSVIQSLKQMADQYPPAGDWFTVPQIADEVKRSATWVTARLTNHFTGVGELRCSVHKNRLVLHYPPLVVEFLIELVRRGRPSYTRDAMINQLKLLAQKLGRTPTVSDVECASKESRCASTSPFYKVFGSFPKALQAAGLPVFSIRQRLGYSLESLLDRLRELAQCLGTSPTIEDVDRASQAGGFPSRGAYGCAFGSHNAALAAAGLPINHRVGHSKDEMIVQLKVLAEKLGRTPMIQDITKACKAGECMSPATLSHAFGSVTAALKAAGLDLLRQFYSREELIEQLKRLAKNLKRSPSQDDIERLGKEEKLASISTFTKTFHSWNGALKAAGLSTRPKSSCYAPEQLVRQLKRLAKALGRIPTQRDISRASRERCASCKPFVNAFGSVPAALVAAGLG